MRPLYFLAVFITLTLANCGYASKPGHKKTFEVFEFTHFNIHSYEAIKITNSDTFYIKQFLPRKNPEQKNGYQIYYALLDKNQRSILKDLILKLDFSKGDETYEDDNIDGDEFRIYVQQYSRAKKIYLHSKQLTVPMDLVNLKDWVMEIKNRLTTFPLDSAIYFEGFPKGAPPNE